MIMHFIGTVPVRNSEEGLFVEANGTNEGRVYINDVDRDGEYDAGEAIVVRSGDNQTRDAQQCRIALNQLGIDPEYLTPGVRLRPLRDYVSSLRELHRSNRPNEEDFVDFNHNHLDEAADRARRAAITAQIPTLQVDAALQAGRQMMCNEGIRVIQQSGSDFPDRAEYLRTLMTDVCPEYGINVHARLSSDQIEEFVNYSYLDRIVHIPAFLGWLDIGYDDLTNHPQFLERNLTQLRSYATTMRGRLDSQIRDVRERIEEIGPRPVGSQVGELQQLRRRLERLHDLREFVAECRVNATVRWYRLASSVYQLLERARQQAANSDEDAARASIRRARGYLNRMEEDERRNRVEPLIDRFEQLLTRPGNPPAQSEVESVISEIRSALPDSWPPGIYFLICRTA